MPGPGPSRHDAIGGHHHQADPTLRGDVAQCSIIGQTEPFPVKTLYNMKPVLQGERGIELLEGLRPSAALQPQFNLALAEPATHQSSRAPSVLRSSIIWSGTFLLRTHLEERVDRLEAQFVGVTTRLNRSVELIERIARH
ncbi:unnamed protein product [Linum trigynum]|uniref:Uncharacterized protein n=1 Tax=Linum trigynum TaxID=586398 RepID=A0AAV2F8Y1_9ROSI